MNINIELPESVQDQVDHIRKSDVEVKVRKPSNELLEAVSHLHNKGRKMMSLHIAIILVLSIGQLSSAFHQCGFTSIIKWSILYMLINLFHIYYYGFQLYLLSNERFIYTLAVEFNQLIQNEGQQETMSQQGQQSNKNESDSTDSDQRMQSSQGITVTNQDINPQDEIQNNLNNDQNNIQVEQQQVAPENQEDQNINLAEQLEGQVKQYIVQKNKSLFGSLTLGIVLAQVSIVTFSVMLYHGEYKIYMSPFPIFADNCQDFLLNIALLLYAIQVGIYFFFYMTCLVLLSFFPFFVLAACLAIVGWSVKRIRTARIAKRFPVKFAEEVVDIGNQHECAICMQEYKPKEMIKFLSCNANHHFHQVCIDNWLKVQSVCPLCRMNFQTN